MSLADLIAAKGETPPPATSDEPELGAPEPEKAEAAEIGAEEDERGAKQVPIAEVHRVRAQRREAVSRAEKAEARVKELETKYGESSKRFEARYGKFEKPHDQMEEDATVAEAMWALKDKPEIQAALRLIQQHNQGVKVSDRNEKPAPPAEPVQDPMVAELLAERVKDQVDRILEAGKVRSELRPVITNYVMEQKVKPTREAVFGVINEYAIANGWTKEFMRGSSGKPRATPLPNPGGLGGGTPTQKDAKAPEKPKNLTGLQEQNRAKFREMWGSRMNS